MRQTLLFADQLWGHLGLHADPVKHVLQTVHSVLMRQVFGLPATTAHWIVASMAGQLPIQHWIVRDFCRFWNKLLRVALVNPVSYACVCTQVFMTAARKPCWLRRWVLAVQRLIPTLPDVAERFVSFVPVPLTGTYGVMDHLFLSYHARLQACGDPFALQEVPHRKIALHCLCLWDGGLGRRPWWHFCQVQPAVMSAWIRFMACYAPVPAQQLVGTDTPYAQRHCSKCVERVVGSEEHVLLDCAAVQPVRCRFRGKLIWPVSHRLKDFLLVNQHQHCLLFVHAAFAAYDAAVEVHVE